ncbi:hypothetical protein B0T11DRAFT_318992 [Plectosphaerella cucumerina]|uniref:JmjC domain-containing protein n=1 Tax=Plectosphaerella cucumerina TaxID=40658 RepID=A0A8K0TFU5_9PEZI|nr:hypothetical protein B0T11DRAFT_318992 [Plectosphaerella cucumerina]
MNQTIAGILSKFEAQLRDFDRQIRQDRVPGGGPRGSSRCPPALGGQTVPNLDLRDGLNKLVTEFEALREALLHLSTDPDGGSRPATSPARDTPARDAPALPEPPVAHGATSDSTAHAPGLNLPAERGNFFLSLAQMVEGPSEHPARFNGDPSFEGKVKMGVPPFDWEVLKGQILDQEGIRYNIIVAGQGDLIVMKPRQYHSVVNYSDCLALAINYLLPGEPTFPSEVAVCNKCGLFHFKHTSFRRVPALPGGNPSSRNDPTYHEDADEPAFRRQKRRAVARVWLPDSAPKRSSSDSRPTTACETRARAKALLELEDIAKTIRKLDPRCNIPTFTNEPLPNPKVLKCASAIRGKAAVSQLLDLIKGHRDLGVQHRRSSGCSIRDQFVQCLQALSQAGNSLRLSKLNMRLELLDKGAGSC